MKKLACMLAVAALVGVGGCGSPSDEATDETAASVSDTERPEYAIVIHGGAGTIRRKDLTSEQDSALRAALNAALDIGEEVLRQGGSALEAVEQTIHYLEDSPLFNAGRGAVFTSAGTNELDASIMDGRTRNAGAVGGVTIIRHPISAARAVMEKSPHVFMVGKGAEEFAMSVGLDTVDPSYFYTQRRWESLQRAKAREKQSGHYQVDPNPDYKFGTVGCVALDKDGNIAAGTSTGGMTNKRWGRIGDSPIIGAGTFADNNTCGVSCTGHGEFFIRWVVAYDVAARMEYLGETLEQATRHVIQEKLKSVGGRGGLIALDRHGNVAMEFNTEGMYRGYARPGERYVGIYRE